MKEKAREGGRSGGKGILDGNERMRGEWLALLGSQMLEQERLNS